VRPARFFDGLAVHRLHFVGKFVFFNANARQWRGIDDFHFGETASIAGGVLRLELRADALSKHAIDAVRGSNLMRKVFMKSKLLAG
jgi:hypothetical protein